jgi:O-antigen/teichoic acid export membrane protein
VLGNIASNIVGTLLPALAALVAVPFLLQHLGIDGFGVFSLQVAALFFFGLADFGISRAIVLLSFEPPDAGRDGWRRPYALGLRYTAMLAAGVLALGAVATAVLWHWQPTGIAPRDLAWSSGLTFVSAAFMLLTQPPRAALEAQQRFLLANLIRGPAAAAIFLAPLAAFTIEATLTSAAVAILITRVLAAFAWFAACGRARPGGTAVPGPTPELRSAFLRKAGWLGLTNLVSLLVGYADRFVLAPFTSAAAVGQYVIAQEVATKLWIASGAVVSAGMPRLAAQGAQLDHEGLRGTTRHLGAAMWGLGVAPAALLVLFAEPLLKLWLRASFDPASVLPLQVMAIGIGVNNLTQINFALLQVHGGEQRGAWLQVFHFLFLCLALAVLVPAFGIRGAALAFTLRLLLDALLVRLLLRGTSREAARAGVGLGTQVACAALLAGLFALGTAHTK